MTSPNSHTFSGQGFQKSTFYSGILFVMTLAWKNFFFSPKKCMWRPLRAIFSFFFWEDGSGLLNLFKKKKIVPHFAEWLYLSNGTTFGYVWVVLLWFLSDFCQKKWKKSIFFNFKLIFSEKKIKKLCHILQNDRTFLMIPHLGMFG